MINPLKAGVTFGALLGGYHFFWSLLVALGWAQPLLDFVFWMHFIQPVFMIRPFSLPTAAALIVFTSIAGFVTAVLFTVLWNKLSPTRLRGGSQHLMATRPNLRGPS